MLKTKNRYLILFAAAFVNFSYGSAYIWSVFQPAAMEKYGLESGSANRPFNIFMALFVVGNITGGKLQQKIGTRCTILLGSFIMCCGFFLTAFVPENMSFLLSATYGVMGGLGAGCAYNALIAGTQKWFPDKRGMVTGIIICTVGAPGLIMTPLINQWIGAYGFAHAMQIVACFYAILCFGLGWIIISPPENYKLATTNAPVDSLPIVTKQYTTSEALKTKQYYLITAAMMLAVPAYFLINPMMLSLGVDRGLSSALALSGVMMSSIFNISGRFVAPWASDKFGLKPILLLLFSMSMISILVLVFAESYIFMICIAFVSFSYGGFFGIFPVIVVEYFGSQYSGMNYGMIMIGYGVVSIFCPSIVSMGITISFVVAAVACILGMLCTIVLKRPNQTI